VSRLVQEVRFPDWLGHLGVLLYYTQDVERSGARLTLAFAPQLAGFVESGSSADKMLHERIVTGQALSWLDLGIVEQSYQPTKYL
jgi:hypothetical protein